MGPATGSRPVPPAVKTSGGRISWDVVPDASGGYAVYEVIRRSPSAHAWDAKLIARTRNTSYAVRSGKSYCVVSIGTRRYSAPSEVVTAE